ncbi:hypothetical protein ZWY2020_034622 [Hordeum vulgare]|nr:hypothetical protein ZWY2020_034622 [Hordeum vulgare]
MTRRRGTCRSSGPSAAQAGFPNTPEQAARSGLVSGKNNTLDRSIQDAYIHAIRRAQHFIYIENQYFLGSSFAWKADDIRPEEIEALHLIPRELSLKIVSKIEAGEHFVVYVVVPMWRKVLLKSTSSSDLPTSTSGQWAGEGLRDCHGRIPATPPERQRPGCQRQVHGFRMSLWYEHLGMLLRFRQPGSLECVQRVNKMADKYWDLYASDELSSDLPGHLLTYRLP